MAVMDYPDKGCASQVDTEILELNITEDCNLRCIYCYQTDRPAPGKAMPFEVATAAIADHLTRKDQFRKVIIELIGGEVFIYWPLIRQIMDWTLQRADEWTKDFVFFIDTNGTLLNDEIKEWLYERRERVILGLSLDGTPEAHNINRCGSYERIAPHLPFIAQTWPQQGVKMTISPQTVPMIYDGIVHIMRQGFRVAANVPMEDIWGPAEQKARLLEQFKEQIERLVALFGEHCEFPLPSLIDLPIAVIHSLERDRPWCGSGRNMTAIAMDGTVLPCNRFAGMSFDHRLLERPLSTTTSACDQCLFKAACQTCEVNNWLVRGNPHARTNFHCEFTKIQVWGTAQVRAIRFERRVQEIGRMAVAERSACAEELTAIQQHLSSIALILQEFEANPALLEGGMLDACPVGR
jgi:uncharacterized protein